MGTLHAQENKKKLDRSKTDATFNPCESCNIHIKDVVIFDNGKMTLEMFRIEDYNRFRSMDTILMNFRKDIGFYKDSLEADGVGNVRIDYVLNAKTNIRKIRFKKYPSDGQSFVKRNNEVSKLKVEQDTVHIIIENEWIVADRRYMQRHNGNPVFEYTQQATFVVNNYYDVDKVETGGKSMAQIMDTLQQAKQRWVTGKKNGYVRAASSIYRLNNQPPLPRYRAFAGIIKSESDYWPLQTKSDYLTLDFNMGAGLVRNTIAPTIDLGITLMTGRPNRHDENKNYNFYKLGISPYFFFDKNAQGNYTANTNMFVTLVAGGKLDDNYMGLQNRKTAFGIGYLALSKGNYFKGTTMKIFTDIQLPHGVTISPELIATDNFKQFFPGLTLKIF